MRTPGPAPGSPLPSPADTRRVAPLKCGVALRRGRRAPPRGAARGRSAAHRRRARLPRPAPRSGGGQRGRPGVVVVGLRGRRERRRAPTPETFSPSPFPCFHRDAASPSGVAFPELARATLSARRGSGGAGRGVLRCLPEQFQPVGVWQSLKEVGKAASLSGRARTSSTAGSSSQQQQSQSVQPPPPPHCRGGEGSQGTMTS